MSISKKPISYSEAILRNKIIEKKKKLQKLKNEVSKDERTLKLVAKLEKEIAKKRVKVNSLMNSVSDHNGVLTSDYFDNPPYTDDDYIPW